MERERKYAALEAYILLSWPDSKSYPTWEIKGHASGRKGTCVRTRAHLHQISSSGSAVWEDFLTSCRVTALRPDVCQLASGRINSVGCVWTSLEYASGRMNSRVRTCEQFCSGPQLTGICVRTHEQSRPDVVFEKFFLQPTGIRVRTH